MITQVKMNLLEYFRFDALDLFLSVKKFFIVENYCFIKKISFQYNNKCMSLICPLYKYLSKSFANKSEAIAIISVFGATK
jgi:hypothetical protein